MRTVSPIIGRVVVVIIEIVAVVRKFWSTIPEATGQVGVVEADTCVDEGNQHTLTCIALLPHLRSIDFQ